MDKSDEVESFLVLIKSFLTSVIQLQSFLEEERELLIGLEIEPISVLTEKKKLLLEEIVEYELKLKNSLPERPGVTVNMLIQDMISTLPLAQRTLIMQDWGLLVEKIKKCKELNTVNSAIVNTSLAYNRKKLNVFLGVNLIDEPIYDRSGILE